MTDRGTASALGSLQVFARSSATVGDRLEHTETYTAHGLLTVFVHRPPTAVAAAIVLN